MTDDSQYRLRQYSRLFSIARFPHLEIKMQNKLLEGQQGNNKQIEKLF